MAILTSTNPAKNYQKIGSVEVSTAQEIKSKVVQANATKSLWKELGVEKRIALLRPLHNAFYQRRKEMVKLTVQEIGKPLREALDDITWDFNYFKEFLQLGKEYLQDEITYKDKKMVHRIVYEPIGSTAVIVPWNFPFANWLWGVIPTLIAGNTVVFKHSEECPLMGKFIDKVMSQAKLPDGIFSQVYGDGKVGEMLANQDIDCIWFTGSSAVGKKLFQIAGQKFVKSVMELGGSNPVVVFDDVDIDELTEKIYGGRFTNCGQVCDCIKRVIVHKKLFRKLVDNLKLKAEKVVIGDPMEKTTELGSLAAKRQLLLLKNQVADAVKKGAKIETGGRSPKGLQGAYYLPTIVTRVKRNMRLWREEVFGPVLPIVAFETEAEAIELANDTVYGLGAQVFSKDRVRARRVADKLAAGCIDINQGSHWKSCTPFGGYKASGMGREHGRHGFQELTQIKVIAEG